MTEDRRTLLCLSGEVACLLLIMRAVLEFGCVHVRHEECGRECINDRDQSKLLVKAYRCETPPPMGTDGRKMDLSLL